VKYFILIFFLLPLSVSGQWKKKYNTTYNNGVLISTLIEENVHYSASFEKVLVKNRNSFITSSAGLGYILGYKNTNATKNFLKFQNSGLAIPINVSYNYSIGSLDSGIFDFLSNKCPRKPFFVIDWFAEAGAGLVPTFYKNNDRNAILTTGYLGLRAQSILKKNTGRENPTVLIGRFGFSPFLKKGELYPVPAASIGIGF
jgi:hypothetical protein